MNPPGNTQRPDILSVSLIERKRLRKLIEYRVQDSRRLEM